MAQDGNSPYYERYGVFTIQNGALYFSGSGYGQFGVTSLSYRAGEIFKDGRSLVFTGRPAAQWNGYIASVTGTYDMLGVAAETKTEGNTVSIVNRGVVPYTHSYTAGTPLYAKTDGTLTTTDTGRKVGNALDNNKLLVRL